MEIMLPFIQEMLMLYILAAVGYASRKIGILDTSADQVITQIVLYITLPALILYSMDIPFSAQLAKDMFYLVGLSVCVLLFACFIGRLLRKRASLAAGRKNVFEASIIFGNQGFIGFAVSFILFGRQGIVYATMFNMVYLILIWSYGIYLFVRSKPFTAWRQVFLNPGLLATGAGLLLFFLPVSWPSPFLNLLENTGKMTIPLSMLLIGSLLAGIKLEDFFQLIKNRYIWMVTGTRLLLIPLFLLPFVLLSPPFALFAVAVLVSGMPSAPTVSLYAYKYGGDARFASVAVCVTTICALVTIPALYFVLRLVY